MFFKRLSFQGIDYTLLGPVVNNDLLYDTDSIFLSFFYLDCCSIPNWCANPFYNIGRILYQRCNLYYAMVLLNSSLVFLCIIPNLCLLCPNDTSSFFHFAPQILIYSNRVSCIVTLSRACTCFLSHTHWRGVWLLKDSLFG